MVRKRRASENDNAEESKTSRPRRRRAAATRAQAKIWVHRPRPARPWEGRRNTTANEETPKRKRAYPPLPLANATPTAESLDRRPPNGGKDRSRGRNQSLLPCSGVVTSRITMACVRRPASRGRRDDCRRPGQPRRRGVLVGEEILRCHRTIDQQRSPHVRII